MTEWHGINHIDMDVATQVPKVLSGPGIPPDLNATGIPRDLNDSGIPDAHNGTGIPREMQFTEDSLVSVLAYSVMFVIASVGNLTVFITLFRR